MATWGEVEAQLLKTLETYELTDWWLTPQDGLDGRTPSEVFRNGESDMLLDYAKENYGHQE